MALGKKIAKNLSGGEVFGLVGELGAGKTVFVKGLAKGLGITNNISSPTFVLMKVYPVERGKSQAVEQDKSKVKHKSIKYLVHVDAYRLKNIKSWIEVGLEEYLQSKESIVIIEWAEKVRKLMPKKARFINIEHLSASQRRIKIS